MHAHVIEYMISGLKANIAYAESNKALFGELIIWQLKVSIEQLESILAQIKAGEAKE